MSIVIEESADIFSKQLKKRNTHENVAKDEDDTENNGANSRDKFKKIKVDNIVKVTMSGKVSGRKGFFNESYIF